MITIGDTVLQLEATEVTVGGRRCVYVADDQFPWLADAEVFEAALHDLAASKFASEAEENYPHEAAYHALCDRVPAIEKGNRAVELYRSAEGA